MDGRRYPKFFACARRRSSRAPEQPGQDSRNRGYDGDGSRCLPVAGRHGDPVVGKQNHADCESARIDQDLKPPRSGDPPADLDRGERSESEEKKQGQELGVGDECSQENSSQDDDQGLEKFPGYL